MLSSYVKLVMFAYENARGRRDATMLAFRHGLKWSNDNFRRVGR